MMMGSKSKNRLVTLTIELFGRQNSYIDKISYRRKKKTFQNKVRS